MKKIVSAALMVLAAGGASAQAYVEAAIGATNLDYGCSGTYSCDNDDTGFKVVGGYKLNRNFAIEGGYFDFGKAKAGVYYYGDVSLKSSAIYVGAVVRGEFAPRFWGMARLGLASVETKFETFGYSESDNAVQPLLGLGLEYAVTKNVGITGAIDFTKSAEVAGMGSGTLRMISLGAKINF